MRLMTEGATDVKGIVAKVSAEIVAATPSIVRGGLRVAKNGVNVLDDVAVACYAGGISGGVAILVCAIEVGSAAWKFSKGEITSNQFKEKSCQTIVGNLMSFGSQAIGAAIGTIVGGVIGSLVGAGANFISRKIVAIAFDDEPAQRAGLVLEAFHFLELPAYHLITEKVVAAMFRKHALECHPDSARVQAKDQVEQAKAEIHWQLLQHAKDVALGFLQNKNDFSVRAKNIIEKKYDAKNRNMTTFAKLRESLDSPKTTENEFLC